MLSKESIKVLCRLIQNAIYLRCVPYEFDKKKFQLETVPRRKLFFYYFVNGNVLIQTCILILQFIVQRKNQSVRAACAHLFRIICNTSGAIFQLSIIWKPNDLKIFLNLFVNYALKLERKVGKPPEAKKSKWSLDFFMRFLYNFSFMYSLLVPLQIFRNPTSPRYVYSIFYKYNSNPKFIPIFVFIDLIYALFSWHVILFNFFIFLSYVHSMSAILELMLLPQTGSNLNTGTVYRSLYILNNEFSGSISSLSLPTTLLTSLAIPITLNFMTIRLHDSLSFSSYVVTVIFAMFGMVFTVMSWPSAGNVNSMSAKFIRKARLTKREKRYLRPIRIRIGSVGCLTKFVSVKIFAFVVYWTMRALLLF